MRLYLFFETCQTVFGENNYSIVLRKLFFYLLFCDLFCKEKEEKRNEKIDNDTESDEFKENDM